MVRVLFAQIIKTYLEFKKSKVTEGNENEEKEFKNIEGIMDGIQSYFDRALGAILLYRMERKQFDEIKQKNDEVPVSELYGAEHLVRLFGAWLLSHLCMFGGRSHFDSSCSEWQCASPCCSAAPTCRRTS